MAILSPHRPFILAIAGALLVMSFSLINGYALVFNDTRQYVRGPSIAIKALTGIDLAKNWNARVPQPTAQIELVSLRTDVASGDKPTPKIRNNGFVANRSVYYGFLALVGYAVSDFWLTVFVQSYLVAAIVAVINRYVFQPPLLIRYFVILAPLCVFSSLGPYSAYIMPDIFCPLLILGVTSIFFFFWRMTLIEKVFAVCLTSYAALAHPSHIVICLGLTSLFLVWSLLHRTLGRRELIVAALAGACALVGVFGEVAFEQAILKLTGEPALVLPHFTAHLQQMGPGYRFLKAECASHPFALCAYTDKLPVYWEDFVGNADPNTGIFAAADLPTKRRLSGEQTAFAIAVLKFDPIGTIGGLLRDGLMQNFRFSLGGIGVEPQTLDSYRGLFPPQVVEEVGDSLAARSPGFIGLLSVVNTIFVALSFIYIVFVLVRIGLRRYSLNISDDALGIGVFAVLGVIVNAFACGILASPLDRYQGRVIWLVPLVALIFLSAHLKPLRNTRA